MASYSPMKKNTAQRIVFPILDADGDPVTGATTPDTEYSLDGASFVDCSDEIHEIATASGIYYIDLLAAETNADVVAIQCKTATSGAKTTVLVFYTQSTNLDLVKAETVAIKAKTDIIGASVALESGGNLATALAETQSHPTLAEIEATTVLAKDSTVAKDATVAKDSTVAKDATVAKEATFTHATYGIDKIKTETASIKAKTDIIGASVALESGGNVAAILADTNELQTDWVNGGRLDLLIDSIITNVGVVDTVVDAIKAVTDLLTLAAIADAVHDEVTEGTTTLRKAIKLISSALFAKTSGGGTATLIARDIGDTKPRITLTVDANGNRTASVLDGA